MKINFLGLLCCIITLLLITISCKNKLGLQNDVATIKIPDIYFNSKDGVYTNENGKFFRNGQIFSGNLVTLYTANDTAEIIPYYNGLEEDLTRKWFPNKKISEERLYHLGKKERVHKGWWENGQQKFIYNFKNDNHEGLAQTWYPNGLMASENNYSKGYEIGMQRAWYSDGVIRANYEARDGRQYGLTGVKNCETVWDIETKRFIAKRPK